jgi:hypothetical protein
LFHSFKDNQHPAFIITNRLPIARRLPCIDQLIGATTILTNWPLVLAFCRSAENIAGRRLKRFTLVFGLGSASSFSTCLDDFSLATLRIAVVTAATKSADPLILIAVPSARSRRG